MTNARQGIEMAITDKMNKAIEQKNDTPLDSSRKTDCFSYFLHIKESLTSDALGNDIQMTFIIHFLFGI